MSKRKEEELMEEKSYPRTSDANPPIKRKAGQTIQEMSAQMVEAYKDSKLMSPVANKEVTEQMRQARIAASIEQKRSMLDQLRERGKVNLTNIDEVQFTLNNYLSSCEEVGVVPNFLGFCAAMGYTRRNVDYALQGKVITKGITQEVREYIEAARTAFAAVMAEASLNRAVSEPTAIFLLKNTGQGLTDRQEVTLQTSDPFADNRSTEEIKEQYKDIIIE
jgi:hypothetical protein